MTVGCGDVLRYPSQNPVLVPDTAQSGLWPGAEQPTARVTVRRDPLSAGATLTVTQNRAASGSGSPAVLSV